MTTLSLAIVFPGQGSQAVGMLQDIAEQYPEIEQTFAEASQIVGYDLWALSSKGPSEELDKTVRTQPALLTASVALWRILKNNTSLMPAILAGHSLGEYTALVCAGAIQFTDAVKLVALRGQYMQEAVPVGHGGLAVIVGLDASVVQALCLQSKQGDEILSPVNFNSLDQVVIGGHLMAVERALVLAKEAGARMAKLLPVSVPSHCILMKPAAERLEEVLNQLTIESPSMPVLNNVDVAFYESPASIRDGLVRQLYKPVRWVELVQKMPERGIQRIIECGPGRVLTGLNKRIASTIQLAATADLASLNTLLEIERKPLGV